MAEAEMRKKVQACDPYLLWLHKRTLRESIRWLIADRLLRMAFAVMPPPGAGDGTGRDLSEAIHLYFLRRSIELSHPIFIVSDRYLRDTAVGERQDHDAPLS